MSVLEILGTIALAIFLAPYAAAAVGYVVAGFYWLGCAIYDIWSWSRQPSARCRCPKRCPRHGAR